MLSGQLVSEPPGLCLESGSPSQPSPALSTSELEDPQVATCLPPQLSPSPAGAQAPLQQPCYPRGSNAVVRRESREPWGRRGPCLGPQSGGLTIAMSLLPTKMGVA